MGRGVAGNRLVRMQPMASEPARVVRDCSGYDAIGSTAAAQRHYAR